MASLSTIATRNGEMRLAFVQAMARMGMEDVLDTLCDQCSGPGYTILMELIQPMKGTALISQNDDPDASVIAIFRDQ
jgi:hypothetical protein